MEILNWTLTVPFYHMNMYAMVAVQKFRIYAGSLLPLLALLWGAFRYQVVFCMRYLTCIVIHSGGGLFILYHQ